MRACLVAGAVALLLTGTSAASWSGASSGSGAARATSLPTGNTPSATVPLLSTSVTVAWTGSVHASGAPVTRYVVRRYANVTGTEAAVGASCNGVVAGLSCTETGVATGSWTYSVTPAEGNWRGGESARSTAVTVPGV